MPCRQYTSMPDDAVDVDHSFQNIYTEYEIMTCIFLTSNFKNTALCVIRDKDLNEIDENHILK